MSRQSPTLREGVTLNHYRIDTFLASGGMGDVYVASDSRLGRKVALKVLRPDLAQGERLSRFHAEARAASSLQHPAIMTVYEQGTASLPEGSTLQYLVLELIEGETLAQRLLSSPPLSLALQWMAQVADGVAAAHEHGIIHRDLKPANVMISRQGWPKILDFGIAKLLDPRTAADDGPDTLTASESLLGTPGYCAPEQIVGGNVDARADVFSMGCILYEIAAGRAPFARPHRAETIQAILNDAPAPLPEDTPPELRRIVRKCLAHQPGDRYQTMKDLAIDLRSLARDLVTDHRERRYRMRTGIAAAALGGLLLFGGSQLRRDTVNAAAPPDAATAPPRVTLERVTNNGRIDAAALSPDGRFAAYSSHEDSGRSVWVKHLDTGNSMRVLERNPMEIYGLAISPDNAWVYFVGAFITDLNRSFVMRVPLLGGEPQRLIADVETVSLSNDGRLVAFGRFDAEVRRQTLFVHDLETGEERLLLSLDPHSRFWALAWHPDGRLTFLRQDRRQPPVRLVFLDTATRASTSIEMDSRPLTGINRVTWTPDGSGMVVSGQSAVEPSQLWYVPVPPDTGMVRKITNDLSDYGAPSMSTDGRTLMAMRREMTSNIFIVPVDEPRKPRALTSGIGNMYGTAGSPRWTPDDRIIFSAIGAGRILLNSIPVSGGTITRLSGEANSGDPAVSRDGSRIAFMSDRGGSVDLWISEADGSKARQLTKDNILTAHTFFPDGKHLAYVSRGEQQRIWKIPIEGGTPTRLTDRAANFPEISPDGRWLLCRYRAAEPGKPLWRTAVLPLDRPGAPQFYDVPRYSGGPRLRWHPDGRSFSFLDWKDGVANVWLQDLDGGEPRQVTQFDSGEIFSYDWSPDGSSLVLAHGDSIGDAVVIRDF